jgi:hypothetical protein
MKDLNVNINSFQKFIELYKTNKTQATHSIAVKMEQLFKDIENINDILIDKNKIEFNVNNILDLLIDVFDKYGIIDWNKSDRRDLNKPLFTINKDTEDYIEIHFHCQDIDILDNIHDDLNKVITSKLEKNFVCKTYDNIENYMIELEVYKV